MAAKILVGVTGSVAAIHTPTLYEKLKKAGHAVKVLATRPALYFFDPAGIDPLLYHLHPRRNPEVVILDEDEWPGQDQGEHYRRGDPVLHIELRRWADLLLIAPLDANTLAKIACGLADNALTCVWRAWDRNRPALLAPAMNTLMWEHPLTSWHFRLLAGQASVETPPADLDLNSLLEWINIRCPKMKVIPPQSKRLACDDVGMGAMADLEEIMGALERVCSI